MDDADTGADTSDERPSSSERTPRPSTDLIARDRYRLVDRLARGGMGEVMVARDEQIGRDVAIKRMRAAEPNDRAIQRFLREARVQGRLEHPAIVPVHEIGRGPDGLPFFVMKKIAGTTLASRIAEGGTLQQLLRAFVDVCLAVEFAHVRGVIHRDLKPENIIVGDFGEVYVLDWGVAKVVGEADADLGDVSSGQSGENATSAGAIVGTPGYMAPEQIRSEPDIDARADVYALGCMLFAILAGDDLHPRGPKGLQSAVQGADARPSQRAPGRAIPVELDALCVEATAKDRGARIATARELGDRVQQFLDGDRDHETRRQLARDHLARGRDAFERDDRSVAMREAGSALALDPALAGAAELLGGLMLEPPKTIPPEVDEALSHDEIETAKINARDGVVIYLAILAFVPLIWWMAPAGSVWAPVLAVPTLLCLAICWRGRVDERHGERLGWLTLLTATITMFVALMFTPLFIAPGFAAVASMTMLFTAGKTRLSSPIAVAIVMEIAVLGPWLLEHLHVLPSSTVVDVDGIHLHPAAIGPHEPRALVVSTLYASMLIILACAIARARREHERETKRQLLVQAWQLRQLLPR
jgi:eukaryotic-like serine/threonine-protein kinase